MKNFLTLFLSGIFLISFIACNEDEEEPSVSQVPLEGTLWVTTSSVSTSPNCDSEASIPCTSSNCETLLLQNGEIAVKSINDGRLELMTGTYSTSGSTMNVTFMMGMESESLSIQYTVIGDVLTIQLADFDGCDRTQTFRAQQSPYVEIPLEGTEWISASFVATGCDDPLDNESDTELVCTSMDCERLTMQNGAFTLNAINNGSPENMTGTYTRSGNTLSVTFEMEGQTVTFAIDYSIVIGVLTFNFTDPSGCDITQVFRAQ